MSNATRLTALATALVVLSLAPAARAQWEGGTRYQDLGSSVSVVRTPGSYGEGTRKTFDWYEPSGDRATDRPLILWAHGGTFTSGSKSDAYVGVMAERFAKYGYPVAAINYRTSSLSNETGALAAATRAIQDMNTAVRYFVANAAPRRIDPAHIYVGGVSAGAIAGLGVAFLDSADLATMPSAHRAAIASVSGGLLGTQHGGYRPYVAGAISLSGAIYHLPDQGKLSILNNNLGRRYVYTLHSLYDRVVPFGCGPFSGITQTYELCGGGYIYEALSAARRAIHKGSPAWLDLKAFRNSLDAHLHTRHYAPPTSTTSDPAFDETRAVIDGVVSGIYPHYRDNRAFVQGLDRRWQRYGNAETYPARATPNVIMLEDGQVGKTALISKIHPQGARSVALTVSYKACSIDGTAEDGYSLTLVLGAQKSDFDVNPTLAANYEENRIDPPTAHGVHVVLQPGRATLRRHEGAVLGTVPRSDDGCAFREPRTYTLLFAKSPAAAAKSPGGAAVKGHIVFEPVVNSERELKFADASKIVYPVTDPQLVHQLTHGSIGIVAENTARGSAQHVISDLKFAF